VGFDGFDGFGAEVFEWFTGLERDNSKRYFTATRTRYEREVRGGLEAMLDELCAEFGGVVRVFRQQRDVRFSPDKSPYKLQTYACWRRRRCAPGCTRSFPRAVSTPARAPTCSPAINLSVTAKPSPTTARAQRSPRLSRPRWMRAPSRPARA